MMLPDVGIVGTGSLREAGGGHPSNRTRPRYHRAEQRRSSLWNALMRPSTAAGVRWLVPVVILNILGIVAIFYGSAKTPANVLVGTGYHQAATSSFPGRSPSSSSSTLGDAPLLTIAIDADRGSCPENCAFIHTLLPDGARWRYVSFRGDDIAALNIDTHALVVTRWMAPSSPLVAWARRHPHSVGAMIMADEQNTDDTSTYNAFDYVLRHYYFDRLAGDASIPVLALGNLTCGRTAPGAWPPVVAAAPRFGVHWVFLQGRGMGNLESHHVAGSHWPADRRPVPAVFIGSLRADRQDMIDVIREQVPGADLQVEESFGGSLSAYRYGHERTAASVFALCPHGNNPETHRLPEALDQGAIPVMLPAAYQRATFEPVPGIVAPDWRAAAGAIGDLLRGDADRLNRLQQQCIRWKERLRQCMQQDLDVIMGMAFRQAGTRLDWQAVAQAGGARPASSSV
ncbi:Glycosyl transferase CAP10 domain-containing protein [Plasmodiophora brassicae]